MTIKADRIFGAVFLALGLGLFIYSFSFHSGDLMGDLGPGFLPGLVGALLAVLGLVQLIWPGADKREAIEGERRRSAPRPARPAPISASVFVAISSV